MILIDMGQTFYVRILHLISHNAVSGPEKNAIDLALGMDSRGHQVFVAGEGGNWMQESLSGTNCTWVEIPFKKIGLWKSVRRAVETVRQEQIDVVHVHLSRASIAGWIVGKLCQRPVVATVHVATTNKIFKLLARPPHRLVAVSGFLKQFLVSKGIPSSAISVIHVGSSLVPQPTSAGENALQFLTGERVITLVGKVSALKGSDLALDAFESLEADYPNLHLIFIGDDQNDFARQLRGRLKSTRVHFLGLQSELASFYLRSEFTILPTEIETFGMVVAESMLCARPVIGSNRGALPELITHGVTGLIIDRNVVSLETAMRTLLDDPVATTQIGQSAQQVAIAKFTLKPMLDQFESLYEDVIQRNPGTR